MSTQSVIGLMRENGTIEAIHCHWDGYPKHVGAILAKHYTSIAKMDALLKLGDISSLYEEVSAPSGKVHTFKTPCDNVTIAYHRDRGDHLVPSRIYPSKNRYLREWIGEVDYCYVGVYDPVKDTIDWQYYNINDGIVGLPCNPNCIK